MKQVWFITGSSRGFGRALVRAALEAGDLVAATARRPEQLADLSAEYGDSIHPIALDVTDQAAAASAIAEARGRFGRLDVIVNNAGYANVSPIETTTDADFRAQDEAVKPERRFAERIFNDPMQFLVDELGPALDNHNIGWAVTGWAAAERLAPFATAVPALQVYIEERALWGPLSLAMQDIPVRWVESGGRIEFRSADSHLLELAGRRNGIPLATAPRVFADLQALGGRGEDAAMHVREEVILDNLRPRRRSTTPSAEMDAWDKRCRDRLKERITDELDDLETVYDSGTWSVSYWIPDVTMPLGELRDALVEVEGRETGWPPWWVPTREGIRPEIQQGGIECWFRDDAVRNGRHPDFWRAEPELKLFLLRDYQEDGITRAPGSALDPVFTVWRMAESLLHSARMARYVNAEDIEFFARWDGLKNRELRAIESDLWDFRPGHVAHDDSIATFVHTSPEEIDRDLPGVVRALVSSLFEIFGLFDPPGSLYATEIATMLERSQGQTGG